MCLAVAAFCGAADFTPVPVTCTMANSSPVINPGNRMEVPAAGFSVLPPQGDSWCVKSLAAQGLSFLKAPVIFVVFGQRASPDALRASVFHAVRFMGLAQGLSDFGLNTDSPEQLKLAVDQMISMHIFSQFIGGITTAERRYLLLESHSEIDGSLGTSCVRFDAKVEARGLNLAPPGVVKELGFIDNRVCAHPRPTSPENRLIWISIVEAYREGDQSTADKVRQEIEPFLRSLQFMPSR